MTLATCGYCPWELDVPSDHDVSKALDRHLTYRHADQPPDTDELCAQLVSDHADEWDVIVLAIETSAAKNNGRVDPNEVRPLIPSGITPQLVGAAYRVLRQQGRLTPVDENINLDKHGRNIGKKQNVYRLVEHPAVSR